MLRTLLLSCLAVCATVAVAAEPLLAQCRFGTNGRDEVSVALPAGPAEQKLTVPAGLIFQAPSGTRVITLRAGSFALTTAGQAEGVLPAAALALTNPLTPGQPAQLTPDREPRLAPLLEFLATRDDLPRATSQCVVFALLHDVTFHEWQTYLRSAAGADETAQAKAAVEAVTRAVDALTILKAIAPGQNFRLYADEELKLRALRQPTVRGQAQRLYGLTLPGDPTAAEAQAPDLQQLFHTQPGDNCPVCRQRQQMLPRENGL